MIINQIVSGGTSSSATEPYLELMVDSYGVLQHSTTTSKPLNLAGATDIGSNILSYAFAANRNITSVNFDSLISVSNGSACTRCFESCTGLTTVSLSSLSRISGSSCMSYMFSGCTSLTSVDLSSLKNISGNISCSNMFARCTSLTSVDLSSLESIIGGYNCCTQMFLNCTTLSNVDLSGLQTAGNVYNSGASEMSQMFQGCGALTEIRFDSLTNMYGADLMSQIFKDSGVKNVYFPAIKTSSSIGVYVLRGMLTGTTGVALHFPSNLDPDTGSTLISSLNGYPNFGGTDTVVLFDLPATE